MTIFLRQHIPSFLEMGEVESTVSEGETLYDLINIELVRRYQHGDFYRWSIYKTADIYALMAEFDKGNRFGVIGYLSGDVEECINQLPTFKHSDSKSLTENTDDEFKFIHIKDADDIEVSIGFFKELEPNYKRIILRKNRYVFTFDAETAILVSDQMKKRVVLFNERGLIGKGYK